MSRTIIVSLPVADLKASKAFYTALGFACNVHNATKLTKIRQMN